MDQAVNLSRRNLLRGRATSAAAAIRPPGAIPEPQFSDACTTCGDCVTACPQHIVVFGSGDFPEIDFRQAECTFCSECIDACGEGALSRTIQPPWQLRLHVEDSCLAQRHVVCQTCGDVCDAEAVLFKPRLGAVAVPQIDQDACTGCGACVAACPENAIAAVPHG